MATQAHAVAVYSRARVNKFYASALEDSPQYVEASALRAKLLKEQQSLPGMPAVSAPQTADADLKRGWRRSLKPTRPSALARSTSTR